MDQIIYFIKGRGSQKNMKDYRIMIRLLNILLKLYFLNNSLINSNNKQHIKSCREEFKSMPLTHSQNRISQLEKC